MRTLSILFAVLLNAAGAMAAAPQGRSVETWDSGKPWARWDRQLKWDAVKAASPKRSRRAIKY